MLTDKTINEKEFPDINFRKCLTENFGEDFFTYGDPKRVKSMDISESGIISLKGIEFLTNLENLDCSFNQIEELDLRENINLVKVNCMDNRITSLQLPKGKRLEKLDCSFNQLEHLHLEKQKNLRSLSCGYNNLNSLCVENNGKLERLYCENNPLSEISGCEKISWKRLESDSLNIFQGKIE